VQLPDEYDEIFEDIEPFWGIDPHELARTQQELEVHDGVVTVQKTDAHPQLEVVRSTLPEDRQNLLAGINKIVALLSEVEQDLPSLRFTVSPFDNPSMLSDWQIKTMALEAAANGTSMSARFLHSERVFHVQRFPLQHSHLPTCLQSQDTAGRKHVPPTRLPVFIRPNSHFHPPPHPSRLRPQKPSLLPIETR
jgi:hypothetical protein